MHMLSTYLAWYELQYNTDQYKIALTVHTLLPASPTVQLCMCWLLFMLHSLVTVTVGTVCIVI